MADQIPHRLQPPTTSSQMTMPPPPSSTHISTSPLRSTSPSKSVRSLARHLQDPVGGSPKKAKDGLGRKVRGGGQGVGAEAGEPAEEGDKKRGLWNLFNAEYEI